MLPHPQHDIRELGEKVLMLRELVKVMRRDVLHFVRAWGNRHGATSQTVAQTKHPNVACFDISAKQNTSHTHTKLRSLFVLS